MAATSSKDCKTGKCYFAFFDLDHTLAGTVSGKELALAAYNKGLMKSSDLLSALWLSLVFRMKLIPPEKAIIKMGSWVKGIPVETMEELCREVAERIILPAVYHSVEGELYKHRMNNAGIVILSSTVEPVCRRLMEFLDLDDAICTRLEAANGILTGKPQGRFCFGAEKGIRMIEYCEKNNCELQDAWYYGDSISDLHALSIVGHPVCINPEKMLEKIAGKKGWDIYYWK